MEQYTTNETSEEQTSVADHIVMPALHCYSLRFLYLYLHFTCKVDNDCEYNIFYLDLLQAFDQVLHDRTQLKATNLKDPY